MPKVAYIPASREELRIDDTLPAKPSKRTSAPAPPVPIDPLMTLMEVRAMLG